MTGSVSRSATFATTRVEGTFSLVYLVFNTIMNLTTQDAQVECFRNAAAHLEPGWLLPHRGQPARAAETAAGPDRASRSHTSETGWGVYDIYDVATQATSSNYVQIPTDGHPPSTAGPPRSATCGRPKWT